MFGDHTHKMQFFSTMKGTQSKPNNLANVDHEDATNTGRSSNEKGVESKEGEAPPMEWDQSPKDQTPKDGTIVPRGTGLPRDGINDLTVTSPSLAENHEPGGVGHTAWLIGMHKESLLEWDSIVSDGATENRKLAKETVKTEDTQHKRANTHAGNELCQSHGCLDAC